jgi:XRE family transcriptional regulator, regulator of sulfur utilization
MNDLFFMLHQATSDEVRAGLSANLRRLRVARHLSLSELARATAMSKATLSGIERGGANPTVDTLAALAGALRVSIGDLLEPMPAGEMRIVRAVQESIPADRVCVRVLEAAALAGETELFELSLSAGHIHETKPRAAGSRSQVLVLHGTMIAGPVERISELTVGDYASFPADVPHVYEAPRDAARALVLAYTSS